MLTIQALSLPYIHQQATRYFANRYHQRNSPMNSRVAICLTLAFFFFGANGAIINFTNKCPYTVWPVTSANTPNPQLSATGFELTSGETTSLNVPTPWSGNFWARTGCSNKGGEFTCETADCGSGEVICKGAGATPPATTAGLQVEANGKPDFYNIDNSNGFNVPMSIAPQGGTGECRPSSCAANVNSACPEKLQQKGSDGKVVACKSACVAFNDAKNCCMGEFSGANCAPPQYSDFFVKQCPQAYNYPNDDQRGTFSCSGGPSYTVTFCP